MKDLDVLEKELDKEDKDVAEEEKTRLGQKSRAMANAGTNVGKQAPKNPRKNNKKPIDVDSVSAAMDTEYVPKVTKPKGGARRKKAPSKASTSSTMVLEDEADDDIVGALKDRLATYNLESSPDQSETMETEVQNVPAAKKQPTKRAAAQKKPPLRATVTEISDGEDEKEDMIDNEFELEVIPEMGQKKPGRKPAGNTKKAAAAKAPAKKRGQAGTSVGQRLIAEVLKTADNPGISPENKVRKMSASPFNKKSGSVLGRVGKDAAESSEEATGSATSITEELSEMALAPRARPVRGNHSKDTYVISDSESEQATEESDFNGGDASASE